MAAEGDARGDAGADERDWLAVLAARRGGLRAGAGALAALYRPLCAVPPGQSFVVAHLAQSLDGRIAAHGGASRWISGEDDLRHTHRMRALADAVIVGADTVLHDDPLLTVRRCRGDSPVRIVIDPRRKLKPHHQVFTDTSAPTIVIAADDADDAPGDVETLRLPRDGTIIPPRAIVDALAARGLVWLFIEGGGTTVSHFLKARCLDRLQVTVAPLLLGSGRPSLTLPEIASPALGLRPTMRRIVLGEDVLFECVFDER